MNDGRFKAGEERTKLAGKKGGSTPHATGTKTGQVYRYKGFIIKWDGRRHLWQAKDGATTLYSRSHHQAQKDITAYRQEHQEFIETEVENG